MVQIYSRDIGECLLVIPGALFHARQVIKMLHCIVEKDIVPFYSLVERGIVR
ncbi:hypothetical protein D3C78_1953570 [compost metagenome]